MLDQGKLQQFVQKMLGDLGGATSIALVRIGHSLGLYKAMEGAGPMTSAQFASKASIAEQSAMRASGCRISPRQDIYHIRTRIRHVRAAA